MFSAPFLMEKLLSVYRTHAIQENHLYRVSYLISHSTSPCAYRLLLVILNELLGTANELEYLELFARFLYPGTVSVGNEVCCVGF